MRVNIVTIFINFIFDKLIDSKDERTNIIIRFQIWPHKKINSSINENNGDREDNIIEQINSVVTALVRIVSLGVSLIKVSVAWSSNDDFPALFNYTWSYRIAKTGKRTTR